MKPSQARKLVFTDTNVLLYSLSNSEPEKHRRAREWTDVLWSLGAGVLSWQVLLEVNAKGRKMGLSKDLVREATVHYVAWGPIPPSVRIVERAWSLIDDHGASHWDSLIVSAAIDSGCNFLLSEDMQVGRRYGSLQVISPFSTAPSELFDSA